MNPKIMNLFDILLKKLLYIIKNESAPQTTHVLLPNDASSIVDIKYITKNQLLNILIKLFDL